MGSIRADSCTALAWGQIKQVPGWPVAVVNTTLRLEPNRDYSLLIVGASPYESSFENLSNFEQVSRERAAGDQRP